VLARLAHPTRRIKVRRSEDIRFQPPRTPLGGPDSAGQSRS